MPFELGCAGGWAVIAVRLKLELRVVLLRAPRSPVFAWKLGDIPRVA